MRSAFISCTSVLQNQVAQQIQWLGYVLDVQIIGVWFLPGDFLLGGEGTAVARQVLVSTHPSILPPTMYWRFRKPGPIISWGRPRSIVVSARPLHQSSFLYNKLFQRHCYVLCVWLQTGFWIIGFINHLQVITTNNYSNTADLHNLQFTIVHSLVFPVCY
jgi:hypothetical protein